MNAENVIHLMTKSKVIKEFADLIACVESGNNKRAFRFEEKIFDKLKASAYHNPWDRYYKEFVDKWGFISRNSYIMLLSTSWGKYQILGKHLKFIDFHFVDYLEDEELQLKTFCEYIYHNYIPAVTSLTRSPLLVEHTITELLSNIKLKIDRMHLSKFILVYNGAYEGSSAYYQYRKRLFECYEKILKSKGLA